MQRAKNNLKAGASLRALCDLLFRIRAGWRVLVPAVLVSLVPFAATGAGRPARSATNFTQRCKAGTPGVMGPRMGWPVEKLTPYSLPDTTFSLWVPENYGGTNVFGLFVYVSPTPSGAPLHPFLPGLRKHRLIYVGANNSGNDQKSHKRVGLALDAAFNMMQRYRIDRERIYIGGISGGGRISSITALGYPDIFRGCLAIVGVNYFREIPVPGMPGKRYPVVMRAPASDLLARARTRSRFVLVTGSKDANRDNTWALYRDGYVKDGFRRVYYREVEGMGHTVPGAETLVEAMGLLE